MLNGMASSAELTSTSYAMEQMDIHLSLESYTAIVTTKFTYISNGPHTGAPLILKGKKLSLREILLNDAPIPATHLVFSKHRNTIAIKQPPPQGIIKITVAIDITKLLEIPGVYNYSGNIVFTGLENNLEHLTYIIRSIAHKSIFNFSFTAKMSEYPLLLSSGKKIAQEINGSQHLVKFEDEKSKFSSATLFVIGKGSVLQEYYFGNEGNIIPVNFVTQTCYIGAAKIMIDMIKACCVWYERKHNRTIELPSYTIVAMPIENTIECSDSNVLLCPEFRCLASTATNTDGCILKMASFIAQEFLTTIDPRNAEELQHTFIDDYFGSATDPVYTGECAMRKILTDNLLEACRSTRTTPEIVLPYEILETFKNIISDSSIPNRVKAELLTLPKISEITALLPKLDIDMLHRLYRLYAQIIGAALEDEWLELYNSLDHYNSEDFNVDAVGGRKLRNLALWYLLAIADGEYAELAELQIMEARNHNDRFHAFESLSFHYGSDVLEIDTETLQLISIRSTQSPFAIDPTLLLAATIHDQLVFNHIPTLLQQCTNAMQQFYIIGRFIRFNSEMFHHASGAGYRLVADIVLSLSMQDMSLAMELLREFGIAYKLDLDRKKLILDKLQYISQTCLDPMVKDEALLMFHNLNFRILQHLSEQHAQPRKTAFSLNNPDTVRKFLTDLKAPATHQDIRLLAAYYFDAMVQQSPSKKPAAP